MKKEGGTKARFDKDMVEGYFNEKRPNIDGEKSLIEAIRICGGIELFGSGVNLVYRISEMKPTEIKELCEEMYHNGEISRTGNYRYFILSEEKKKPKPKKTSASKSQEVDVEKELEKFKGLLDKGLITQEDYDAKKKELLGL